MRHGIDAGCGTTSAKGIFYIEAMVSDLGRSQSFYGDTLGWKLNTDLPNVAGFFFGTGYLVLLADVRPPPCRQYAGGMHVEVLVQDVVAEHKRLKDGGVAVSEVVEKHWGERKFSFSDPDGYRWSYGQPT
jgi:catechol 2,3-dioxygenase-like lactoylglutathione lyase family enzyme